MEHIPGQWSAQAANMSLRDYFAAMAMQALITSGGEVAVEGNQNKMLLAMNAYRMADLMLEKRGK